jgi:hypothetical protein
MSIGFFGGRKARGQRGKQKPAGQKKRAKRLAEDFVRYREAGCDGCPLGSENLAHPKMEPTGAARCICIR